MHGVSSNHRPDQESDLVAEAEEEPSLSEEAFTEVYQAFLESARRESGAAAAVLTFRRPEGMMSRAKLNGMGLEGINQPLQDAQAPCGSVVDRGAAILCDDLLEDPKMADVSRLSGVRAYVGFPLTLADGTVAGSFSVTHSEPLEWDEDIRDFLHEIALFVQAEVRRELGPDRGFSAFSAGVPDDEKQRLDVAMTSDSGPFLTVLSPRWSMEGPQPMWERLTGQPQEACQGWGWLSAIRPADREQVVTRVARAICQGSPVNLEYHLLAPDGTHHPVRATGMPVGRSGGAGHTRAVNWVVIHNVLMESEGAPCADEAPFLPLTTLGSQLEEGVIVAGPDGTLVYINEKARQIHGVHALGVAPQDFSRVYNLFTVEGEPHPPEDLPLSRAIQHGETVVGARWVVRSPDGVETIGEGTARPIVDAKGTRTGAVLTFRDVTQEVRAHEDKERLLAELEEAYALLEAREQWFRALIEDGSDLVTVLDREGRMVFASPARKRILGHTETGILEDRLPAAEKIHPEDREEFRHVLARAKRIPGVTMTLVARVCDAQGRWLHMELRMRSLLDHPAVNGIVVNARDITPRRRAEAALMDSQRALREAQKMESMGRMAGGVAHDFNNILSSIIGLATLAGQSLERGSPVREDLAAILASARQGAGLTRRLLAFSRRGEVPAGVLDVHECLRENERMIQAILGDGVELRLEMAATMSHIHCEPGHVEQVALNLAANARDAISGEGRVTVRTRSLDLGRDELAVIDPGLLPGPYLEIQVEDTGAGMDADTLELIFEPFFTTKAPGEGTGLGLSTVFGIIKQLNGHIRAESRKGEGTRFFILIPAVPVEGTVCQLPEIPGTGEESRAEGKTGTVLVVDDDEGIRSVLKGTLRRSGYDVLVAGNGGAALEVVRDHPGELDLVITDVVIPGTDVTEMLSQLRELRSGFRVIHISGYPSPEAMSPGIGPMQSFIPKPFTPDMVREKVREVLEG